MEFLGNTNGTLRPTKLSRAVRCTLLLLLLAWTLSSAVTYAQDGSQPPSGEVPLVAEDPPSEPSEVPTPHPDAEKVVYIAEVTIESDEDLAKLQQLGHSCPEAEPCEVEATEPQLSLMQEAGLAVDVVGIVAEWSEEVGLALASRFGAKYTDYNIMQGSASASTISITGAPAGSKVGRVKYTCRVAASGLSGGPSDYRLNIRPGLSGPGFDVWYRQGGATDGGFDDDAANDRDIYLYRRNIYSALDGHAVNQTWTFTAQDFVVSLGGSGKIDYWKIWVYYCPSVPATPMLQVPFNTAHICDTTPFFDWVSVVGATSYNFTLDDSSLFSSPAIYTQGPASNYQVGTPLARKTWYWRVRAFNDCSWGPWSPVRSFTIDSVPAVPMLVQPAQDSHTCDSTPTFVWTAASGANFWLIEVYDNNDLVAPVVSFLSSVPVHTPPAPLAPDEYYWRVKGNSACGFGAWSSLRSFFIAPPLGAPGNPAPANGATGVGTGANLNWSNVGGATTYAVYFGTSPSPPFVANVTASWYNLPALSGGTKYYWKIVARKGVCNTAGPTWSFTTGGSAANQAPTNGTINPNSGAAPAGTIKYFTTTCFDPDGNADLMSCRFQIGRNAAPKSLAGNAVLAYHTPSNTLRIRNNAGTKWWGGKLVGSANVIQNNQAKVYCNLTTVTKTGNKVEVTWAVEFKPAFVGGTKMYLKARDRAGLRSAMQQKGTWTVQ